MLKLRRKRIAFVSLAIMALFGSLIAGAVLRYGPAANAATVADSVLGTIPICHNAGGSADQDVPPGHPTDLHHDCLACLAGFAAPFALVAAEPDALVPRPMISAPYGVLEAPDTRPGLSAGGIGSRGPPSSI